MVGTADGPGVDLPGNAVDAGQDTSHQRLWERYMEIERRELEDRRNGELGKVLGAAMTGESQEELDRMAREDRERAERGLVELVEDDTVVYKHIDDLTLEDRTGRIKAQQRRLAWAGGRLGMPPVQPSPGHLARARERREHFLESLMGLGSRFGA